MNLQTAQAPAKYELVPVENHKARGLPPYRVKALRDCVVPVGTLGGFVDGEHNLSQTGDCWIGDSAIVRDVALVTDGALVMDSAIVEGNARIADEARVYQCAIVSDNAIIDGSAMLLASATVRGHAVVSGSSEIAGFAAIRDHALVADQAVVDGNSMVEGNARVLQFAWVTDRVHIGNDCKIGGSVAISGTRQLYGNTVIMSDEDIPALPTSDNGQDAIVEMLDAAGLAAREKMCGHRTQSGKRCENRVGGKAQKCSAGHTVWTQQI